MKEPCLLRLPVDFANQKRSNAKSLYSLFLLFDTAMRNFAMTFYLLYNMGFFIRYDTLWTVDCGLWTVDCGLWTVDCGLSSGFHFVEQSILSCMLYVSNVSHK